MTFGLTSKPITTLKTRSILILINDRESTKKRKKKRNIKDNKFGNGVGVGYLCSIMRNEKREHLMVFIAFLFLCYSFLGLKPQSIGSTELIVPISTPQSIDSSQPIVPAFVSEPSAQMQPGPKTDNCSPLPYQPPEKVETFRDQLLYKNFTEVSEITGEYDSPLAICKLDMGSVEWMNHFPHVMQHLYVCVSFWMDRPSKIPVLLPVGVGKSKFERRFKKYPFLNGFMELLESQLRLQVLNTIEIEEWLLRHNHTTRIDFTGNRNNASATDGENSIIPVNPKVMEISMPPTFILTHARELNEMAIRHYNFGSGTGQELNNDNSIHKTRIKIGFLNREESSGGRFVINANDLVQRIESEIARADKSQAIANKKITLPSFAEMSSTVSLEYFEGKTFEEQIRFFNSVDILVSPHGAQLTGIPFMANKDCAQVIEFFPNRYFMPYYYGSLAIDSGIGYSHVYLSDETVEVQLRKYSTFRYPFILSPSGKRRIKDRSYNMCIDTSVVLDAIQNAIQDWGNCQREKRQKK